MKYLIPMLFASSLLTAETPELTLRDLTPQHMEQIQEGTLNCTVHFQEGDELPLQFNLSGDTLAFKTPPENGSIVVLRPFYIQVKGHEFLFSLDKEEWQDPSEFFTGYLSAAVGTTIEPFATIDFHADVR